MIVQDFQNFCNIDIKSLFALYSRENKFSPFIQVKNMNVPSELEPPESPQASNVGFSDHFPKVSVLILVKKI